jgi:hypothetical protein
MVAHAPVKRVQRVADVMRRERMSLAALVTRSGLDERIVRAIVNQHYTPSPKQRRCVAAALGVRRNQLCWGHALPVESLYGPV